MNESQLKQRMSDLPKPPEGIMPPYWDAWRLNLWQHIVNGDNPKRFWEWPCVYHTMLVAHWVKSVDYELSRISNRLAKTCSIPHFGPDDDLTGYPGLSMNLIHQAYHIQQWEQTTGKHINQLDTIVEFGGGYGAMALLCHRLGFSGKYVIYDLPEFSLLQEYYLSQFGLLDKVSWNPAKNPKPQDIDLYIGLYSLSEIPIEDRASGQHPLFAKSYLFLYSGQWESYNNVEWFQERWPKLTKEFGVKLKWWQHTELTHLPDRNNFYSIGF